MLFDRYPFAEGSVFITGTSSGIGKASAVRLANAGFHVFAGVRKTEDGAQVASLVLPGQITPVVIDVTSPNSVSDAAAFVRDALIRNNSFLAGVISNAGVGMISPAPYLNEAILQYQTQTNLLGHMRLAREFLPVMQDTLVGKKRRGRFYFVGTGAGIPSLVFPFLNIYMACKWGTEAFCQSLRMELKLLKEPIDVGMINPGFINTAMRATTKNAVKEKLAMDPQFGQLYGKLIQKFGAFGDRQRGTSPDVAADAILSMMMSVSPHYRYRVGKDSISTYLQALLPLSVQEWMVSRVYR